MDKTKVRVGFGLGALVAASLASASLPACGDDPAPAALQDGGISADDAGSDGQVSAIDLGTTAETSTSATDACAPSNGGVEICDDVDNDCNGLTDEVDIGNDGISDCLRIALLGGQGANPSSDFNKWLQEQGARVERIQTMQNDPPLDATRLANYDVVIADRLVRAYTTEEKDALALWVRGGGGFMAMTGYSGGSSDRDFPGSLLSAFGLSYRAGLVSGPVTMFEPHPITTGLDSVSFLGGFPIDIAETAAATSTVIARLPGGPAAVVQQAGAGRVFVWGDEWITFDSEWRTMPAIKALWVNTLAWLVRLK